MYSFITGENKLLFYQCYCYYYYCQTELKVYTFVTNNFNLATIRMFTNFQFM